MDSASRGQSSIFALFVFPFSKCETQPQLPMTPGGRRGSIEQIQISMTDTRRPEQIHPCASFCATCRRFLAQVSNLPYRRLPSRLDCCAPSGFGNPRHSRLGSLRYAKHVPTNLWRREFSEEPFFGNPSPWPSTLRRATARPPKFYGGWKDGSSRWRGARGFKSEPLPKLRQKLRRALTINDYSVRGGKRRWRARTPKPAGTLVMHLEGEAS